MDEAFLLVLSLFVMAVGLALRSVGITPEDGLTRPFARTALVILLGAAGALSGDALAVFIDAGAVSVGPAGLVICAIGAGIASSALLGRITHLSLAAFAFVTGGLLASFGAWGTAGSGFLQVTAIHAASGAAALAGIFVLGARRTALARRTSLAHAGLGTVIFVVGWLMRYGATSAGLPGDAAAEAMADLFLGGSIAALAGCAGAAASLALLNPRTDRSAALAGALAGLVAASSLPLAPIEIAASLGAVGGLVAGGLIALLLALRLDDPAAATPGFLGGGLVGLALAALFDAGFLKEAPSGLAIIALTLVCAFIAALALQVTIGLRPRLTLKARG